MTEVTTPVKPSDRITLASRIGKSAVNRVTSEFYDRIQKHPTLKTPFSSVQHWPEHKDRIAQFWWVALGGQPSESNRYDPVAKHLTAGFNENLLMDWKVLFKSVLYEHLAVELANAWFERVELIGSNLLIQNNRLAGKDV